MILIGNKIDREAERQVTKAEAEVYKNSLKL